VPAAHGLKNGNKCVNCRTPLNLEVEEVLSRPELGVVHEVRPGQIELGLRIDEALKRPESTMVFAEGGCGIGKTYSYLVPVILRIPQQRKAGPLAGTERVVICTAKKSLQDQLATKDVPHLLATLGRPDIQFVNLKGKSNYACERLIRREKALFKKNKQEYLHSELMAWVTEDGCVGDFASFPGELAYPASECSAKECVGAACTYATRCGYRYIRQAVSESTLILTNHSMVGIDLRLSQRVLQPYGTLIVDEAHAFPDFARNAFASTIGEQWMQRTLNKLTHEQIDTTTSDETLKKRWTTMFQAVPEEKLLQPGFFGDTLPNVLVDLEEIIVDIINDMMKQPWFHELERRGADRWAVNEFTDADACSKAIVNISADIGDLALDGPFWKGDAVGADNFFASKSLFMRVLEGYQVLSSTTDTSSMDVYIWSREDSPKGGTKVVRQPVDLAAFMKTALQTLPTSIFTSATLDGDLLEQELGRKPDISITQPSPFNFKANGLLYLPKHLPHPNAPGFIEAASQEIVQLVRVSKGNALVLFTSLAQLEQSLGYIDLNYKLEYPIFAQAKGRLPTAVLNDFLKTDNSVLFGSKSFFEGIDVAGCKLSLVIVVKIPFPQETAITLAKKEKMGRNFWPRYYFPHMLMDLKQAAGRLIRTATDSGVVAFLDRRIWVAGKDIDPETVVLRNWSGYGKQIVDALPFDNFTPRMKTVKDFYDMIARR